MADSLENSDLLSPKRLEKPRWNWLSGTFWAVFAFFVPQVALFLLLDTYGVQLNLDSAAVQFGLHATIEFITLAVIFAVLKQYGASWRTIGFTRPSWQQIALGAAMYIPYIIALVIVLPILAFFFPFIDLEQVQEIGFQNATAWELVFVFISLVIIPPLVEETLFRGFLLGGYAKNFRPLFAIVITSALFGLAHMQWNVGIDTFILSLFLCFLRFKTNNIWPAIILHATKNFVAFYILFIIRAS